MGMSAQARVCSVMSFARPLCFIRHMVMLQLDFIHYICFYAIIYDFKMRHWNLKIYSGYNITYSPTS